MNADEGSHVSIGTHRLFVWEIASASNVMNFIPPRPSKNLFQAHDASTIRASGHLLYHFHYVKRCTRRYNKSTCLMMTKISLYVVRFQFLFSSNPQSIENRSFVVCLLCESLKHPNMVAIFRVHAGSQITLPVETLHETASLSFLAQTLSSSCAQPPLPPRRPASSLRALSPVSRGL